MVPSAEDHDHAWTDEIGAGGQASTLSEKGYRSREDFPKFFLPKTLQGQQTA